MVKFLKSPGSFIPGTKMSFAGLRSEKDRINLIAYLRTNADTPAPVPAPKPKEEPKADTAPAADAAKAGEKPAADAGKAGEKPAADAAKPGEKPAPADKAAPGKAGH